MRNEPHLRDARPPGGAAALGAADEHDARDEELLELPELDGDDDGAGDDGGESDELDEPSDDLGTEEATGLAGIGDSDLPPALGEESADEADDDESTSAVGADEVDDDADSLLDDDSPDSRAWRAEDAGELLDDESHDDDGGASGTGEAPEDALDDDPLPELSTSEDDEDDGFEEPHAELVGREPARLLRRPERDIAVPCALVRCLREGLVAAGGVLTRLAPGGRPQHHPLGFTPTALASLDGTLVAGTERGLVVPLLGPEGAASLGVRVGEGPVTLASSPGRLWACCDGALVALSGLDAPPVTRCARGLLAITALDGGLLLLVRDGADLLLERLRRDDERATSVAVPPSVVAACGAEAVLSLCATRAAESVALATTGHVAWLRADGAEPLLVELPLVCDVAFLGVTADAPLVALARSTVGLELLELTEPGRFERVGVLPDAPPQGAAGLAWDAEEELLWVACAAGLFALGPARRH